MAGGRPTEYSAEFCDIARKLCENGATDREVSDNFDVNVATLYRWKAKYPEFCEALKAGKEVADERVVHSLYHKAIGYTFDAVHFSSFQGYVTATPYQEHVPPDTTAAIFWLKNRRSQDWRDKSEQVIRHEHVFELSDDELARIAAGSGDGTTEAPRDSKVTH